MTIQSVSSLELGFSRGAFHRKVKQPPTYLQLSQASDRLLISHTISSINDEAAMVHLFTLYTNWGAFSIAECHFSQIVVYWN